MRVAFVCPRYGAEIVGGAELAVRMLAERLARQDGLSIEVYTTNARDTTSFAGQAVTGTTLEGGVTVHRFAVSSGRQPGFAALSDRVLFSPGADRSLAWRFLEEQGPVSHGLLSALADSPAEIAVFFPYLYHPIVAGMKRFKGAKVLQPAAHDEPALRLPIFQETFASADGLVFQSRAERRLVTAHFQIGSTPSVTLGLGIDTSGASSARPNPELIGAPYLLSLGRVDDLKGSTVLAEYFAAFKATHPGPLRLVMAGPIVQPPPDNPEVILTGPVDDETKWALLKGATLLVSGSYLESFSLVIMEAWSAGKPVLVNGACQVTRDHCRASGGGLYFFDYGSFEVALERLLCDADLSARLADAGRRYVSEQYSWSSIIGRYRSFLERVSTSAARGPVASQS